MTIGAANASTTASAPSSHSYGAAAAEPPFDRGGTESRRHRQEQHHEHREARRHAKSVEAGHMPVKKVIRPDLADEPSAASDLGTQRHEKCRRRRNQHESRDAADPLARERSRARRDEDQQRENNGEHAGISPEIPDADRKRPDTREAIAGQNQQHEQRVYRCGRDKRPRRPPSMRVTPLPAWPAHEPTPADTLPAIPTAPSNSADTVGNRSPSAFGKARIRRPHSRDSAGRRPVAEHVCRKRFHFVQDARDRIPAGAVRGTEGETAASPRSRPGRDRQRNPYARVSPEPARRDLEERVRQHERREEQQEVAVREVLRDERGAGADERCDAPRQRNIAAGRRGRMASTVRRSPGDAKTAARDTARTRKSGRRRARRARCR